MSREIKFRAWDKENNDWIYSNPMPDMGFWKWVAYDSTTIFNEWTGLLSKDGVEIYEGDIVEGGFEKHRGVVSFGLYANPFGSDEWTGYQGFYIKWSREHAEMTRGDMGYWINRGMETAIEVIGNIYEHSHLLENESKEL